jgi:hypothetical protein
MKHFMALAAIVGLASTGCASNALLSKHQQVQGEQVVRAQSPERRALFHSGNEAGGIKLTGGLFGKKKSACDDVCCGEGCDANGCAYGDGNGACGGDGCGAGGGMFSRMACGCNPHAQGYPAGYSGCNGPPVGQTAYPYYTVRGPRDFLVDNPPSIGPY